MSDDTTRPSPLAGARLFAGVAVADVHRSIAWFDRFLGMTSFAPNESERVWSLSEQCHLYVELAPVRAGGSLVTLFVEDLEAFTADAARHGVHPESREAYDNGVKKANYRDPDGNHISVGGAPT